MTSNQTDAYASLANRVSADGVMVSDRSFSTLFKIITSSMY